MTYLFSAFLIELIWEFTSNFFVWFLPLNVGVGITFVMNLIVLSLFLLGAINIGREQKLFSAVFVISIILIVFSCVSTTLTLSPVEVFYEGLTDLVPVILGFMLTYQVIKGIIVRHQGQTEAKSAKRLMTYFKTSLWLIGGLVATFVVGLFTIMGAMVGGMMGTMVDPDVFLVPDEELISVVISEVLPAAGPFLIVVAVLLIGLLLAYIIIRILFVVTVYQLKNVKDPAQVAVEPLPAVE